MATGGPISETERKAELVRRFVGPVAARDTETVDHWRAASAAEHAAAMIELAAYAEQIAAQTGLRQDPDRIFPAIATMRRSRGGDGGHG